MPETGFIPDSQSNVRRIETTSLLYVITTTHKLYYLQNFDQLTEIIAESPGDTFMEGRKLKGKKREHAGVEFE